MVEFESVLAIGIDPGTATTGYGLVRMEPDASLHLIDYGVIRTSSKSDMPERLIQLYQALEEVISEHQPRTSAVEKLFFQRNVTSALSVGQARGVAMLALAEAQVPVGEYTPMEIKQAVAGYGGADKRQIQLMVQRLLHMEEQPSPDDAADALAVAICHLQSSRTQRRIEGAQ
ncbi:MAG: crossover junction endodeoxyribonuclease RuvC [Anaerolineales bacterium]